MKICLKKIKKIKAFVYLRRVLVNEAMTLRYSSALASRCEHRLESRYYF